MLDETCKRCGSDKLELHQSGMRTAIYCASCGKFVRWIKTNTEIRRFYEGKEEEAVMERKAFKKIVKIGGNTTIRCGECGCQLHSTRAGAPAGQFDLINAAFCPQCGYEFIDEQKILHK